MFFLYCVHNINMYITRDSIIIRSGKIFHVWINYLSVCLFPSWYLVWLVLISSQAPPPPDCPRVSMSHVLFVFQCPGVGRGCPVPLNIRVRLLQLKYQLQPPPNCRLQPSATAISHLAQGHQHIWWELSRHNLKGKNNLDQHNYSELEIPDQ